MYPLFRRLDAVVFMHALNVVFMHISDAALMHILAIVFMHMRGSGSLASQV